MSEFSSDSFVNWQIAAFKNAGLYLAHFEGDRIRGGSLPIRIESWRKDAAGASEPACALAFQPLELPPTHSVNINFMSRYKDPQVFLTELGASANAEPYAKVFQPNKGQTEYHILRPRSIPPKDSWYIIWQDNVIYDFNKRIFQKM